MAVTPLPNPDFQGRRDVTRIPLYALCGAQACEERQRAFERRQAEMREQVAKFEKFISENDAKRARAEAKVIAAPSPAPPTAHF